MTVAGAPDKWVQETPREGPGASARSGRAGLTFKTIFFGPVQGSASIHPAPCLTALNGGQPAVRIGFRQVIFDVCGASDLPGSVCHASTETSRPNISPAASGCCACRLLSTGNESPSKKVATAMARIKAIDSRNWRRMESRSKRASKL